MHHFLLASLSLGFSALAHLHAPNSAPLAETAPNKYIRTPTGFLVVLRQGDNVLQELEQLATREKIQGATLTGLGFGHPTFGFWNAQTKTYDPKAFRDLEMASLTGSIAWKDGKPVLHLHGVGADKTFTPFGGHILALEVGTGSMEIAVTVLPQRLTREVDPQIGAPVMGW